MKTPKPRHLSSGNYFIQLRLGGESVPVTARSATECSRMAALIKAEHRAGKRVATGGEMTLREAMDRYIKSRDSVLSPTTVHGYDIIKRNRFKAVTDKRIKDVSDWQTVINEEIKICSPKTLKNAWMFAASSMRYHGITPPSVTLPQVPPKERPYLDPEQIPVFLQAIMCDVVELPALLALHSLRLSEIYGLEWDKSIDIKRRAIIVSGAVVRNTENKLVAKETNKNTTSQRTIPILIPRLHLLLIGEPDKFGKVVSLPHSTMLARINAVCRKNDLPEIGMHGLRHSFASLAYHLKISEKIAMQIGGWADATTMHKIYTHIGKADILKSENLLKEFFENAN